MNGGISYLGVLTKFINWSWIWILCPIWIPIAIAVLGCICEAIADYLEKK